MADWLCFFLCLIFHEKGAQVDVEDEEGETALMKASFAGHYFVVRFLLDAGQFTYRYIYTHINICTQYHSPVSIRASAHFGSYVLTIYLMSLDISNGNSFPY